MNVQVSNNRIVCADGSVIVRTTTNYNNNNGMMIITVEFEDGSCTVMMADRRDGSNARWMEIH